jgi:hypothetical protein
MTEVPQTQTQTQTPFGWGAFIGGLVIAIVAGAIGNVILGAMSMGLHHSAYGFLLGCATGALLIIIGFLTRRASAGFAAGLICGGCILGLIGGICGASMVNTSFR